jgi:hypothetical protein
VSEREIFYRKERDTLTWLMARRMTNLGNGREARESQKDGKAEKHHGVQSDPYSVHDDDA